MKVPTTQTFHASRRKLIVPNALRGTLPDEIVVEGWPAADAAGSKVAL